MALQYLLDILWQRITIKKKHRVRRLRRPQPPAPALDVCAFTRKKMIEVMHVQTRFTFYVSRTLNKTYTHINNVYVVLPKLVLY